MTRKRVHRLHTKGDSAVVKRALAEALDDKKHHRYVTLRDYLGGKRSA